MIHILLSHCPPSCFCLFVFGYSGFSFLCVEPLYTSTEAFCATDMTRWLLHAVLSTLEHLHLKIACAFKSAHVSNSLTRVPCATLLVSLGAQVFKWAHLPTPTAVETAL